MREEIKNWKLTAQDSNHLYVESQKVQQEMEI